VLDNPKTDEREVVTDLFSLGLDDGLLDHPDGLVLLVDKGYRDPAVEQWVNDRGVTVIRPAYRTEPPRPGRGLLRALRQSIESVTDTFKGHSTWNATAAAPIRA
jgi:hypothetical protein